MCAEGLSSLINASEKKREIHGISAIRGGLFISHLLFADCNIIFCQATTEEWARVANVLKIYEKGSGQVINQQKSPIFFSSNTSSGAKDEFSKKWEVTFVEIMTSILTFRHLLESQSITLFSGSRKVFGEKSLIVNITFFLKRVEKFSSKLCYKLYRLHYERFFST